MIDYEKETAKLNANIISIVEGMVARIKALEARERELVISRETQVQRYWELVDALCSESWQGRNRHDSVVGLAKRLRDSQTKIRPLELNDIAQAVGFCIRPAGHAGPCNGLPRDDCFMSMSERSAAKERP